MKRIGASKQIVEGMFHELKVNPPAILAKTRRKKGPAAAEKQRIAIGLNKSRTAGARLLKKTRNRGARILGRGAQGHA